MAGRNLPVIRIGCARSSAPERNVRLAESAQPPPSVFAGRLSGGVADPYGAGRRSRSLIAAPWTPVQRAGSVEVLRRFEKLRRFARWRFIPGRLPVWWHVGRPNFGDDINPVFFHRLAGLSTCFAADRSRPHVLGAGSILEHAGGTSVVCGAGFLRPPARSPSRLARPSRRAPRRRPRPPMRPPPPPASPSRRSWTRPCRAGARPSGTAGSTPRAQATPKS